MKMAADSDEGLRPLVSFMHHPDGHQQSPAFCSTGADATDARPYVWHASSSDTTLHPHVLLLSSMQHSRTRATVGTIGLHDFKVPLTAHSTLLSDRVV